MESDTKNKAEESIAIQNQMVESANNRLINYMYKTLEEASDEVRTLRAKFSWTYWIIVWLSIIMFVVGVLLISIPAFAAFNNNMNQLTALAAAGLGIGNLAALFIFRPITRLHYLMGDMGQITVILNSFQTQVALRLLESDVKTRESLGEAAHFVNEAAEDSLRLIQHYFEEDIPKRNQIRPEPDTDQTE